MTTKTTDTIHDKELSALPESDTPNPNTTAERSTQSSAETLLDSSNEALVLLDREGHVIYANPAAEARLDCGPGQSVGRNIFEMMPADARSIRQQIFAAAVATNSPQMQTYSYDGKVFQTLIKPLPGADGELSQLAVYSKDITDQARSERQCSTHQELLRTIVESTADGILVVDEAGKVILANERFAELWRIPEELLRSGDDERLLEYVLDQLVDPEAFLSKVRELYSSREESFDTLQYKDGRVFERYSKALVHNDTLIGRIWSFRDVSRREQATNELKSTLSRYRSLFEDAPIAMYEVDLSEVKNYVAKLKLTDSAVLRAYFKARPEAIEECISLIRIGDVNPSCLKLYEAGSRAEFVEKYRNVFSPEMINTFIDALTAIARGNTLWKAETSKYTCAGRRKDVIIKVSVCPGFEDTLGKALISVTDISELKAAEKTLSSSETMLRTVINATQDAMISLSEEGLITLFNPAAERMFGVRHEEMIGQTPEMLMPEEYRKRHTEYVRSYFATGKPNAAINRTIELPAVRANGEIFPIEISLAAGESDGKRFVIGVIRDITERRRAQEALEDSELRFRDLVEHAGIAIVSSNREGKLLFFNDKFAELFGYERSELEKLSFDRLVHPEDVEWLANHHQRRFAGERVPTRYDFRGVKKDGTILHLDISVSELLEDGKVVGTRSYILDITELKEVEAALRESEERFQSFSETVTDVIYRYDVTNDKLDFISQSAEAQTGYPLAEIQARPHELWNRFTHPDDVERVRRQLRSHVLNHPENGTLHTEYRIIRKDGRVIWVNEMADLEFDGSGNLTHINSVVHDITIQKLREQERLQLESQMQQAQKMESLGVLAGGIAHEFNNMLGGILGTAELMLSDLPTDSQLRRDLEQIMAAAGRAAHLTDQMLAYSGKGAFVVRPCNLSQVVSEFADLLQAAVPKSIRIEYELSQPLPSTIADLSQIRQVLMNLVLNASEALEERTGTIRIRTGIMEADSEYLQDTIAGAEIPPGSYVYVEVCDEGAGMEQVTLTRMFEPFFTTRFAGRGLGLAAVDGIVRGHNGTIRVDSKISEGTCVRVLLPAANQKQPLESADDIIDSEAAHGIVLIADAEETTNYLARRILQRGGYRAVSATDEAEVLALLSDPEHDIDLILLDTYLPRTGEGGLEELLASENANVPVILTGQEHDEHQGLIDSYDGFVHKPYRPQELLEVVEQALSCRQQNKSDYSI